MPHYASKIFVLVFAAGAALMCGIAGAATANEETAVRKDNAHSAVPAKSPRPIYIFLPDAGKRAAQMPVSWDHGKQTAAVANNNEGKNGASPSTAAPFLDQKTRSATSLMIGWVPAKEDTKTTVLYQPEPHKFASTERGADCQTAGRTASDSVETPDGGSKGLHPPAGWMLGMCLHY